jgi:hypothetical protein
MTDSILNALVLRRSDMMGRINKAQADIQQMHADLAALDSVIQQIDPEYRLEVIRPRYQRAPTPAEFGSISRTVLDVLRRAQGPQSARTMAEQIIAERGLNTADPKLRRQMAKRVDMALRYQRTNGMVREEALDGVVGWAIED